MIDQITTTTEDMNGELESGQYGHSTAIKMINWRHPRFGEFRVEVTGFGLGETYVESSNTWTQVQVDSLGDKIVLDAYGNPNAGVKMFQAIGSAELIDCTEADPDSFVIPVLQSASGVPSTRQKDQDNFNLDFLEAKTGYLAINQISFVKRGSLYWLCFQELYRGKIVKISAEEARRLGEGFYVEVGGQFATIVPVHAEYAHRFANPWTMFPESRRLAEYALKNDACRPLRKNHTRPVWEPVFPELPQPEALPQPDTTAYRFANRGTWDVGVVAWYNLVLGFGHVVCRDGKRCFVHFSSIETHEGQMPILHSMQQVILRHREGDKGRQATYVVAA